MQDRYSVTVTRDGMPKAHNTGTYAEMIEWLKLFGRDRVTSVTMNHVIAETTEKQLREAFRNG